MHLILLNKHVFKFPNSKCMSITVLLQKTRASYVFWFNFGGCFLDEEFVFQKANFHFLGYPPKTPIFQTILRKTAFHVGGYAFGF